MHQTEFILVLSDKTITLFTVQKLTKIYLSTSPDGENPVSLLAISSATNDVATLSRGMLNSFEMTLKTDMETPAEANSTEPMEKQRTKSSEQ